MTSNDVYRVNVGPISVEGRYNRTGEGPTVSIYEGFREWARIDLHPKGLKSPQGPHYHTNPYLDPSAVATIWKVGGVETPEGLLVHLLEVKKVRGLAVQAGEVDVVDYLDYMGDSEVKARIYRMVEEIYRVEGRQN